MVDVASPAAIDPSARGIICMIDDVSVLHGPSVIGTTYSRLFDKYGTDFGLFLDLMHPAFELLESS
jgi:hypothetical protein